MKNNLVKKVLNTTGKILTGATLVALPYLGISQTQKNNNEKNLDLTSQVYNGSEKIKLDSLKFRTINGTRYFMINKKNKKNKESIYDVELIPFGSRKDAVAFANGKPNAVYTLKDVKNKNQAELATTGPFATSGSSKMKVIESKGKGQIKTGGMVIFSNYSDNLETMSFAQDTGFYNFIADTTDERIKQGKILNFNYIPQNSSTVDPNKNNGLTITSPNGISEWVFNEKLSNKKLEDITTTKRVIDSIVYTKKPVEHITPAGCNVEFKSKWKKDKQGLGIYRYNLPANETENGKFKYGFSIPCTIVDDNKMTFNSSLDIKTVRTPIKVDTTYETLADTIWKDETTTKKALINLNFPTKKDSINLAKQKATSGQLLKYSNSEDVKSPKKKRNFNLNIDGRIKVGAGITTLQGYVASINPQIKVSDNFYLGVKGSYTNSTRKLEEITKEPGFRQLVSLPAKMYFVSSDKEVKENTKIQNDFDVALNASYLVSPHFEFTGKVGTIGQKTTKTMQSIGEEYMEIAGEKDLESVDSYNETNTSKTNNPLFKGSPVYVGAGAEYKCKNFSFGGDLKYITGENSGLMGSLKFVYNFLEGNKK